METVGLANSDLSVSRVGMGGCPIGGHGWGHVDDGDSIRAVRRSLEMGVNFFDTADCYGLGHSETILAEALGQAKRDVVIATKFGVRWDADGKTWKDISPAYLREALEGSLKRLGLERIPLYYIHWPDGTTPVSETVGELARCREEGKIDGIGVSNFSAEQLAEALSVSDVQAIQVRYSLIDRAAAEAVLPAARRHGVPLVTWGSLSEGLLTGKFTAETTFGPGDRRSRYEGFQGERFRRNLEIVEDVKRIAGRLGLTPVQVVIRWLLDSPGVGSVLFGAKNTGQVEENVAAVSAPLTEADYRELDESARRVLGDLDG